MPGPTGPPGRALERELKLDVPKGFVVPDLSAVAGLTVGDVVPDDHVDTYYDTPDLRLIRAGVTLRHRQSGGGGEWTVKLPRPELGAAAGLSRLEINQPGRPGRVPAVVARLVRARARTAPLRRAARLSNRRQTTVLVDGAGEPMVRIDDDTVDAATPTGPRSRFREIEVELLPAAPAPLLDAITPALEAAGARPSDQTPSSPGRSDRRRRRHPSSPATRRPPACCGSWSSSIPPSASTPGARPSSGSRPCSGSWPRNRGGATTSGSS
jgi:hypothetical protein